MGPRGGDELNLIERGGNYGYPRVSNGDHYDGRDIPDHSPGDGFVAPKVWWTPVISPGDFIVYSGNLFPGWRGDALVGGLSGQALVRVDIEGDTAREAERWDMGERIREVEQAPDGSVWLLEDGRERPAAAADAAAPRRRLGLSRGPHEGEAGEDDQPGEHERADDEQPALPPRHDHVDAVQDRHQPEGEHEAEQDQHHPRLLGRAGEAAAVGQLLPGTQSGPAAAPR